MQVVNIFIIGSDLSEKTKGHCKNFLHHPTVHMRTFMWILLDSRSTMEIILTELFANKRNMFLATQMIKEENF